MYSSAMTLLFIITIFLLQNICMVSSADPSSMDRLSKIEGFPSCEDIDGFDKHEFQHSTPQHYHTTNIWIKLFDDSLAVLHEFQNLSYDIVNATCNYAFKYIFTGHKFTDIQQSIRLLYRAFTQMIEDSGFTSKDILSLLVMFSTIAYWVKENRVQYENTKMFYESRFRTLNDEIRKQSEQHRKYLTALKQSEQRTVRTHQRSFDNVRNMELKLMKINDKLTSFRPPPLPPSPPPPPPPPPIFYKHDKNKPWSNIPPDKTDLLYPSKDLITLDDLTPQFRDSNGRFIEGSILSKYMKKQQVMNEERDQIPALQRVVPPQKLMVI